MTIVDAIENSEFHNTPYPFLIASNFLARDELKATIELLSKIEWELAKGTFFEFYRIKNKKEIEVLQNHAKQNWHLIDLQAVLENKFGVVLQQEFEIDFQKYIPGSGIGSHTDFETNEIRAVLNINNSWDLENGGIWILSDKPNLDKDRLFLPPECNSLFAFQTSIKSFHALSVVKQGISFGLVVRYKLHNV